MDTNVNIDYSVPIDRQDLNVVRYNLGKNIKRLCDLHEKLIVKPDVTPCDIIDLSWLFEEKCKMIDNVLEVLKDSESNILVMTEGEMLIDLYDNLVKQNDQQKLTLKHLTNELEPLEKNLSEMKMSIQQIDINQETIETSNIETPEMLNMNLLQKNSSAKLREIRNKLHTVLDRCFKNTKMKQLIQDLTVAYFEGGDNKYINISDTKKYSICDIKMLKESSLIVEDPYNNLRIKIDDIN